MSDWNKRLGQRIRNKRIQKKYSQEKLGECINYSQDAISRIENGERRVDAIALFSLAEEFDCSVDELNPFDY